MSDLTDNKELMDTFYEETQRLIDEMRKLLSDESRIANHEQRAIHELFLRAHTIKGNSGSVGFDKLEEIAQALEKIFKAGGDEKFEINTNVIPLLSEAIAACQKLLRKEKVVNYKELLERLNSILHL